MHRKAVEDGREGLAANIVKITIYAIGTQRVEPLGQIIGLVINCRSTTLPLYQRAFFRATRDTDYLAPSDIRSKLADDGPDPARRTRQHQCLTALRFATCKKPRMGRKASHPQRLT